ncbi:sulfatase-like hydrolase/transferase [Novosphingobium album (ex Liu et al. 2023)]|uniref:Sulfatase-like hydrolase/transferase n=1 Tax=Novosphingobium album (ex Liu et al. 2023) TaxID=3031130 RepID=A0ABT5WSJ6_9SPHN|nr:sulfatase-like hydrolase/transferase [Novosphingobium album (ex Liu et al. 2023)]MDE8652965.1 sulfatase-like hydrolase/transferase [Novosphingobium album (ex Liu et al. 2023)]
MSLTIALDRPDALDGPDVLDGSDRPAATPRRNTETRAFLNWLACWLVLPNLPFLPITLMGGPPRYPEVVLCGLAGLIARRLNYAGRAGLFLALMAYLVISFIARMFNMAVTMILSVIGLVFDMNPQASIEYVAGAALLLLILGTGLWLLRQPSDFRRPRWLFAAVGATLLLTGGDYAISKDAMGSYARTDPHGAPFSSASSQAGFAALADGKTNLLLIVVEAMGEPRDPALRARLDAFWMRPELAGRYEMIHGTTPYFGSTTSGEIRELCGHWGNYDRIRAPQPDCLPALLARQGYRTTSYHAFEPEFFDRSRWYPLIGFQRMVFGQELLDHGAGLCPNVFPGACDRSVPGFIRRQLETAKQPQFIYWLTLNSHLPIVENKALGTEHCEGLGAKFDGDFPMICRLFSIWGHTADALVKEIGRPDFPPTDILIVGDHMPPFTQQRSRLQFDAERVPWILLRHRAAKAGTPGG